MKVFLNHVPILSSTSPTRGNTDASGGFEKILSDTLEGATTGDNRPSRIRQPDPPITLGPVSDRQLEQDSMLTRIDNILNLLETYQHRLADSSEPISGLRPLVETLDTESQSLREMIENVPGNDRLRSLVSDTLVTTTREVMKFKRGDYI